MISFRPVGGVGPKSIVEHESKLEIQKVEMPKPALGDTFDVPAVMGPALGEKVSAKAALSMPGQDMTIPKNAWGECLTGKKAPLNIAPPAPITSACNPMKPNHGVAQTVNLDGLKPGSDGGSGVSRGAAQRVKEKLAEPQNRTAQPQSSEETLSEIDQILERLQRKNKDTSKSVGGLFSDPKTMERLQKLLERFLVKYLDSAEDETSDSDLEAQNEKLWDSNIMLANEVSRLRAENAQLRGGK